MSLALIVAVLASVVGCGGHAPVEAQERSARLTTFAVEPSPIVSTPMLPTVTGESEPAATMPSAPEPTSTVYDPSVPDEPDREPEEEFEDVEDSEIDNSEGALWNIDIEGFQERVAELVGDVDGELEVVVALPDGTVLYERESYEPMESASLYKLAIMVELYRQREAGELTFDESIVLLPDYFLEQDDVYDWDWIGSAADLDSLLTSMIAFSSNVAAAALLARLGNDAINETMADLGLHDTVIRWTPGIWVPAGSTEGVGPDFASASARSLAAAEGDAARPGSVAASLRADEAQNVTTAADVAALFQLLLNGEVVSPEASEEMLALLARQVVQDRIPRYLPDDTVVAHKTGNWNGLVHDAGVIWAPSGAVIVVVLSDIFDEGRAVELIASIALEAYLFDR